MIRVLVLGISIFSFGFIQGQNEAFIDSLKSHPENQILILKSNCVGCLVINHPCEEYYENGNPWNQYIIWKNNEGYHLKRFNNCGSSAALNLKKWKGKPFELLDNKSTEIDSTKLKYPLSYNTKDSLWFETEINHYEYFQFSFPSHSIAEMEIKKYAFREEKQSDDIWENANFEFKKNRKRYFFNNSTAIKFLLDNLIMVLNKNEQKLKIINKLEN